MDVNAEVCRLLLRKLSNRITLAEQAAEEARQICHEVQEYLFDIEEANCPIRNSVINKMLSEVTHG